MKNLNHLQLIEKLNTPGTKIVGLLALVDARAKKTNNPHGRIDKQVRVVGFVGADYETSVNREATRQDATPVFQAEKLPWGKWHVLNKVIEHNGGFYLRTQTTPGNRRVQPAKVLFYRGENGQFLAYDDIKDFLPEAKESNKQQSWTGINKTVWVRTYKFSSILRIRINGETFKLIP